MFTRKKNHHLIIIIVIKTVILPECASFLLPVCIVFFSLIIVGKLFLLQIVQGSYYRNISDSNRLRTKLIHAPRGIIFDRNGKPLVFNSPGFREEVNGEIKLLSQQEALSLIAKNDPKLEVDNLRNYPFKEIAAHTIGYIGQITKEDLLLPEFKNYNPGELIGKMGIEKQYESDLKGTDGKILVEVDATGRKLQTLGQTDPIPGKNITITLDIDLQQKVFEAMKDVQKGAAIVTSPHGEILSLISKPSFDPNFFTLGANYSSLGESTYTSVSQILSDNQNQPLLNRTIAGMYPPGSTFKLVTAAAGLETRTIDEKYTVDDTGILKVGDFSFANWYYTQYGKTEGTVDIVKAIKRSNDIFFYKVGEALGVDALSNTAKKFGSGQKLGIDLPEEAKGLVPTKEWKKKAIGENWYLGDDYHYGIGQGYLLTTPLQVNSWTQAIANRGSLYQPHLLQNQEVKIKNREFLSEKTVSLIREGMLEACSPGGVAWPLFKFKIKNEKLIIDGKNFLENSDATTSGAIGDYREVAIACKTGTAQHGGENTEPHAWITLFAPAFNPQVIITVLAEDSGEGANVAAPIAKKILEAWFEK